MSDDDETRSTNIVAGVIRDLIARVEGFEKTTGETFKDFEKGIADRQAVFEKNLFDQFVALRQDIFTSYLDLKIKHDSHEQKHLLDDQRTENDKLIRAQRQFTLNLILGGIAFLVIVGFIILGTIVLLRR